LDESRWQIAAEMAGVFVLNNKRALPRAWLVTEAEAVNGEEALRRIRGESNTQFEPGRTALLEVTQSELPNLPGGNLAAGSAARIISYDASRLRIETDAPTPSVLVVSEIFYPGWVATVDGQPSTISVADYLLRSVTLSPGHHQIEMRYAAPAARAGAFISAVALTVLLTLAVYAHVFERRRNL
jgi:hypothetical protein